MKRNNLKNLINDAFYAPEPALKENFIRFLRPRKVSMAEMIVRQIPYIGKLVWAFSALMIAVALIGANSGSETTVAAVAALMPFSAAIGIFDTNRSKRYNMSELEAATRFSLRSVIFARMTILGILSLIAIVVISPIIAVTYGGDIFAAAVRIIIPYLITMIVSLHIERTALGRGLGFCSIIVAVAVSFFSIMIESPGILSWINRNLTIDRFGIPMVAVLLALTYFEQWKTVRNVEAFA
ncbi:MAG: hypothetical protein J6X94_05785 [Lachnospiraceae bacterium]|nr:hypothetical protein [Lachnospiraceae bacterium]